MIGTNNMKKGFTLIEMLVTVGLFAIIITIAVGGFVNAERTQRQVSSLISAQSNVSLALEQMSREIRTGYYFCHTPGDYTNKSVCDDINNTSSPTCAAIPSSSTSPTLLCPSLNFYDAEGNEINYSWNDGALTENINSSTQPQSITGNTVYVKYLKFQLFGQTEGDHWPPRITISLGIAASSTDPAVANDVFNLETTVSARTIDCVPGTTQC
jgi:prepilin-type N-terminal cleavage/methylation domain-containing protein